MNSGFVKLHRQIKGHWVTTRPEWFQAWTYILMSANYETGRVNLTEVYRELSDLFDNRAWRYLIEKLQKDGMLADLEGRNLGSKAGYQQTGTVANWSKYHEKSRGARGGADVGASAEHYAEQTPVRNDTNDTPARSRRPEVRGASAEHYAESNKNTFQEVKEKSSSEAREASKNPESEKTYAEVAYIVGHHNAEWLRDKRDFDFDRALTVWGERLEGLWRRSLDHPSRKAGDRAIFRFQDACEGNLDFDDMCPTPPLVTPPAERLPPGTPVSHPVWGDDVIRYYRQDGQIVLNDCGALVPPSEVTPCLN